jgi:hypothetical protein
VHIGQGYKRAKEYFPVASTSTFGLSPSTFTFVHADDYKKGINTFIQFENRVLRRVFGPKRDEVTEEWRKLHNEELNVLYSSPNIVWVVKSRDEVGGAFSAYGGEERRVQDFGEETWGK